MGVEGLKGLMAYGRETGEIEEGGGERAQYIGGRSQVSRMLRWVNNKIGWALFATLYCDLFTLVWEHRVAPGVIFAIGKQSIFETLEVFVWYSNCEGNLRIEL